MLHVSLDQVASGESGTQRQLTSQDSGSDDTSEATSVVTGVGRVRSADTEDVEHSALRLEDSTATKSTDFERGHRDGDLKGTVEAE